MLNQEERLSIGLDVLKRFKAKSKAGESRVKSKREGSRLKGSSRPSLQTLLEQAGDLAPLSIVLGACEDGLPFLVDLTNPAPGSLLIVGDRQTGKTRLLRSLLASATLLNTPEEVSFYLIGSDWGDYLETAQTPHCLSFMAPGDLDLNCLLAELVATMEERRHEPHLDDSILILAVDDLASLLQSLDQEGLASFHRLVRHGPRSRVWTIAGLTAAQSDEVEPRVLAAFRTRLMGPIAERGLASYLAGRPNTEAQKLVAGSQFCVPYNDAWERFWICDPEDHSLMSE